MPLDKQKMPQINQEMPLIKAENISFSYDKRINAVEGVSLEIKEGQYVAIIGHNGSGKSTLAKIFNGLVCPDSGSLIIDGLDVFDKKQVLELRKRVGVVFQNPDNQIIASIVEDDVAFGPENLGVDREEIGKRIDFALSAVGMQKYRKSSPARLSGGQKQRIAIAGVLALKPKVLVLDESTAMLDPKGRKDVLKVAEKLNKEHGVTVINITHYMDEVVSADKVIVMNKGKIALTGTPTEIFSQGYLIKEYKLELPLPALIANELKERGVQISKEILTEQALLEELCK